MSGIKRIIAGLTMIASLNGLSADVPLYKPSSRSPEAIDISTNVYGESSLAPSAISIADFAPDFQLPVSGGSRYRLSDAGKPVAVIFYRGHW